MENKESLIINIPGNREYFVNQFILEIYGAPHSYGGGFGLIRKGYPGFFIEAKKELTDKEYKTKIIYSNINKRVLEKIDHIANSEKFNSEELENLVRDVRRSSCGEFLRVSN